MRLADDGNPHAEAYHPTTGLVLPKSMGEFVTLKIGGSWLVIFEDGTRTGACETRAESLTLALDLLDESPLAWNCSEFVPGSFCRYMRRVMG